MNDICIICGKRMPTRICECGFDISKNYDSYRTLSAVPKNIVSTYQKKVEYDERRFAKYEPKKDEESKDGSLEYEKATMFVESKEHKEAIKWYQKAAEKGHERAMLSLGLYLLNGSAYGVDNQPEQAKVWWLKASQSRDNSIRKIAKIYLESYLDILSEERIAERQQLYNRLCISLKSYEKVRCQQEKLFRSNMTLQERAEAGSMYATMTLEELAKCIRNF